jgi:hypothetical protein
MERINCHKAYSEEAGYGFASNPPYELGFVDMSASGASTRLSG